MTGDTPLDVSVVIGFKDWGVDRLRLAVETLVGSFGDLAGEVIVSDYGSRTCPELAGVVEELGGRHVYTPTDGVWSRSRALNAGFAEARGRVLVSTDADMLFSPGSMEGIGRSVLNDSSQALVLQCRNLPDGMGSDYVAEHGLRWDHFEDVALLRPRWGMGGMMAVSRDAFLDVRGFDERMQIYGGEDLDFAQRVRRSGRRISWIEDPGVRIYHMWHPSSRDQANETPEGRAAIEYNRDIYLNDRSVIRNTTSWRHRPPDARPVASVVICTRNRSQFLRESIDSALAQTVSDIEVVVVDDGSDDDTKEVLEGVHDERLRHFSTPPRGIPAARNLAAQQSRGKYTVVHDDDDLMMPDRVERHLASLEAGDSGTYGAWVDFNDEDGSLVAINRGKPYSLEALLFTPRVFAHPTLMLETDLIRSVGYDERFTSGSDYNLAVRLARLGVRLRHTGGVHTVRRIHPGQITTVESTRQRSVGRWTSGAALGVIPAERHAALRAAANKLEEHSLGLDDAGVAELVRPYLPDRLVTRDVHVTFFDAPEVPVDCALAEVVEIEDLLHLGRPPIVCGVLAGATWSDLAAIRRAGGVTSVVSARSVDDRVQRECSTMSPLDHARRMATHLLASLPSTSGALVAQVASISPHSDSALLGRWEISGQEVCFVALPGGQPFVDAAVEGGAHVEVLAPQPPRASSADDSFDARPAAPSAGGRPAPGRPTKGRKGGPAKARQKSASKDRPPARGRERMPQPPPAPAPAPAGRRPGSVIRGLVRTPKRRAALLVLMLAAAVLAGVGWVVGQLAGLLIGLAVWGLGTLHLMGWVTMLRLINEVRQLQTGQWQAAVALRRRVNAESRRTTEKLRKTLHEGQHKAHEQILQESRELHATTMTALSELPRAHAEHVDNQVRGLAGRLDAVAAGQEGAQRLLRQLEAHARDLATTIEDLSNRQQEGSQVAAGALRNHLSQVQALLGLFELVPLQAATPELGGWAASPDIVLWLVDEMLASRPEVVLECGSGTSTLWFALVARHFGLPTRIVALEHDEHFARATSEHLRRHGLSEYAEVRWAPLHPIDVPEGHDGWWYDSTALKDLEEIGLVFVDGPPGTTGPDARLPAVPALVSRLAPRCTVVLDDTNRPDEAGIGERWREWLPDFTYEELQLEKGAVVMRRTPSD